MGVLGWLVGWMGFSGYGVFLIAFGWGILGDIDDFVLYLGLEFYELIKIETKSPFD
jgi:hypothetical protein